jgi:UDP-N-acetylmuramate: L-alanyl-gamma-D-glutamyl-meso-diaminopimelate ligase
LPDLAVVNNIEFDHADIYADLDAVTLAFRRLVNLVPRRGLLLLGADSAGAFLLRDTARSRVETFGLSDNADWQAYDLESDVKSTRFRVRRRRIPFGGFEVPLLGAHNVRNALAAIAVATDVGLSAEQIAGALHSFAGVKRRLEVIGTVDGVTVCTTSPIIQPRSRKRWPVCGHRTRILASGPFSNRARLHHVVACFRRILRARLRRQTRC